MSLDYDVRLWLFTYIFMHFMIYLTKSKAKNKFIRLGCERTLDPQDTTILWHHMWCLMRPQRDKVFCFCVVLGFGHLHHQMSNPNEIYDFNFWRHYFKVLSSEVRTLSHVCSTTYIYHKVLTLFLPIN